MLPLEAITARLLADLAALPESGMRLALFSRTLASLQPEEGSGIIGIILKKGPEDAGAAIVRAILVDNDGVLKSLGQAQYDSIYLASLRLGLVRVSRFFTDFEAHREGVSGYEEEEFIKTAHLTLGERRGLAKSHLIRHLEKLLSDPDPEVVENLLNNPRITEKEVLKIASKRPNSPVVLKRVALHNKWSKRYDVLKAISRNPYAPTRVSIALVEFMLSQDLSAISEDTTIHPEVKQAAKEVLAEKGGKGQGKG